MILIILNCSWHGNYRIMMIMGWNKVKIKCLQLTKWSEIKERNGCRKTAEHFSKLHSCDRMDEDFQCFGQYCLWTNSTVRVIKRTMVILNVLKLICYNISNVFFFFKSSSLLPGECGCGCVDAGTGINSAGPVSAPSNGSKTAHTKVATSGGHANTQAPSKRSSSGADGDYHLVQHEVLYSLLAEYEVRWAFTVI